MLEVVKITDIYWTIEGIEKSLFLGVFKLRKITYIY
jgi:hypothetical protein